MSGNAPARRPGVRPGQVIQEPAGKRIGEKVRQAVISTPCCGVTYHVDLKDILWHACRDQKVWLRCGKPQHGRGNPGDGCEWPYYVEFADFGENGLPTTARWHVGRG